MDSVGTSPLGGYLLGKAGDRHVQYAQVECAEYVSRDTPLYWCECGYHNWLLAHKTCMA